MSRNIYPEGLKGLQSDRLTSRPLFVLKQQGDQRLPEIYPDDTGLALDSAVVAVDSLSEEIQFRRELVIVDGSCTDLRRLHSELALVEHDDIELVFAVLYPHADHVSDPLQLLRDTVFQHQDLAVVHLLLRMEAGEMIFGRETVTTDSLLGDQQQLESWCNAVCQHTIVLSYEQINDYAPAQQVIPSELIHPLRLSPVLMAVEQEALVFVGSDSAVQVTESVLTLSPESGTIATATVRISDGFVAGEDELVYTPESSGVANGESIQGNFDRQTGILELTGVASSMEYGEALKQVYFLNNSANPADHLREIEIMVSDAGVLSNVMTRPVTVYPVHSSPALDELSRPLKKGNFADSIKALDCAAYSNGLGTCDTLFTIIEPAYGFDVLKNGEPVFDFLRSDIDAGSISLFQDNNEVASGTIYLEVDDGSGGVFGVVVSVGKFGAIPDHGLDAQAGPNSRFPADPDDARPPSGESGSEGDDKNLRFGT